MTVCAFRKALMVNSSLRLLIIGEGDEEKRLENILMIIQLMTLLRL